MWKESNEIKKNREKMWKETKEKREWRKNVKGNTEIKQNRGKVRKETKVIAREWKKDIKLK